MSKKVFYTCYQPYLLDVAIRMYEEQQWSPVYWFTFDSGFPEVGSEIRKRFPNLITQDYNDAMKGKVPDKAKSIPIIALDNELLEAMSKQEISALSMMDRNNLLGNFDGYTDRLNTYFEQLAYWNSVLEYLKPDLIFMESIPHELCDFLIYHLAKIKGIQTIMFNPTFFNDTVTTIDSYEDGQILVVNAYRKLIENYTGEGVKLSEKGQSFIDKINGKYEDNLRYDVKDGWNELRSIQKNSLIKKMISYLMIPFKLMNFSKFQKRLNYISSLFDESQHSYHKLRGVSFQNSHITNFTYNFHIRKANRNKKRLLNYYNNLASQNPDLNTPFIYCPLHFQPEATTSPLGGNFVHQHLMIEMLAKSLPKGWKLYVKEHMAQFIHSFLGEPIRTKEYYDRIRAIENVEFISLNLDSYSLIDKCKAVATITGTVAFEAVVRSKPVLAFGYIINYYPCEGIFITRSNEELNEALSIIQNNYLPNQNKIKLFVKAIEENSYRGGVGTPYNNGFFGIYRKDNAEGHIKAIAKHFTFFETK